MLTIFTLTHRRLTREGTRNKRDRPVPKDGPSRRKDVDGDRPKRGSGDEGRVRTRGGGEEVAGTEAGRRRRERGRKKTTEETTTTKRARATEREKESKRRAEKSGVSQWLADWRGRRTVPDLDAYSPTRRLRRGVSRVK